MNADQKLKHLEFIQNVVTRMNTNSFLVKGWSVTLLAAIFALAAKEADHIYAIVVYLPVAAFWGLDAFFLSQERQYRGLYNEVAKKDPSLIDFSMNASGYNVGINQWFPAFKSRTLIAFHGTLLCVTLIVMFVIPSVTAGH